MWSPESSLHSLYTPFADPACSSQGAKKFEELQSRCIMYWKHVCKHGGSKTENMVPPPWHQPYTFSSWRGVRGTQHWLLRPRRCHCSSRSRNASVTAQAYQGTLQQPDGFQEIYAVAGKMMYSYTFFEFPEHISEMLLRGRHELAAFGERKPRQRELSNKQLLL